MLAEENPQFQPGTGSQKPQAHKRMRSANNHAEASSSQLLASPPHATTPSPLLSSAAGLELLASPLAHDVPTGSKVVQDEELVKARPRRRGVAQKLAAKPKRKRVNTTASNIFVVPEGFNDEAPLPKRIEATASTGWTPTDEPTTGKRKNTAKGKRNQSLGSEFLPQPSAALKRTKFVARVNLILRRK